jgi:hypothetical protein
MWKRRTGVGDYPVKNQPYSGVGFLFLQQKRIALEILDIIA